MEIFKKLEDFSEEDFKKMKKRDEEGKKFFDDFFDIVFEEMMKDSVKFVCKLLTEFGIKEADQDFQETFVFLVKDVMYEKADLLEEIIKEI